MSNKNPKTYEEQLEILKKRNLKILDEKRAKKILSVENYYALINGYKEFFLKSSNPEIILVLKIFFCCLILIEN